MKKYIFFILIALGVMALGIGVAVSQDTMTATTEIVTDAPAVVDTSYELPAQGATAWEWIQWFIGIIGFTTLTRVFFRFVPTAVNVDWVGKIIQIINIILGAWIPNKAKDGGYHKRNYSK